MSFRVYLYHSNDLHSHFEQWPKITTYFHEERAQQEMDDHAVFFFDIGDHMDRANAVTEATMGKCNVSLMNITGYHDVAIGNNEGITLSKNELDTLYEDATFNVLVGNLFNEDDTRPSWAKPFSIYDLKNGVKVGVIGLTVAFNTFYNLLGWKVKDPIEILSGLIKEVKEQADVIILLSHLGINEDERIAAQFDDIDVILGGHTHHLFEQGKIINNTLLGAAGKWGKYVGKVMLDIDTATKSISEKQAWAIPLETARASESAIASLNRVKNTSQLLMNEEVVELNEPLDLSWFHLSTLPQILSEALKEWCDAEISMLNAGVILEELPAGIVTKGDLHRICPHPINPCKVVLRGDELKEVIHQSFTDEMQKKELKGLGFRGKLLGRMIFDGVEVTTDVLEDGLTHVTEIQVLGEDIDMNRNYVIATLDMFTFGFLYPEITNAPDKKYYLPEMLRDILSWKLKQLYAKS